MNKVQALQILGLDSSASDDDIRKKFKKLAAKKHPDINKSENAEQEYKKLSEAYEYLKSGKDQPFNRDVVGFGGIRDIFSNFVGVDFNPFAPFQNVRSQKNWNVPPATSRVNITFQESVLGCEKDIDIKRCTYCTFCMGNGVIPSNDTCEVCKGTGQINLQNNTSANSVFIIQTTCNNCLGSGKKNIECEHCSSNGYKYENATLKIKIPGGLKNNDIIRLRGGHLRGKNTPRDEALIYINVKQHDNMKIINNDVVSILDISLLEALKGCNKQVETVFGEKTISIKEKSKNKDNVIVEGCGVNGKGCHIFILDINYPDNIDNLIEFLEENK